MNITKIQNQLSRFASERDWEQFHTPKNLSMALSVEASELVEIFQWLTPEESTHPDQKQTQSVQSEVADIAMYLIRICQILEIDLESAIQEKIIQNENKYPVELSKGTARKYNQRGKQLDVNFETLVGLSRGWLKVDIVIRENNNFF